MYQNIYLGNNCSVNVNTLQPEKHIWISALGHHRFGKWLVACSAPCHYLNPCWSIVNRALRNRLQIFWIKIPNFYLTEVSLKMTSLQCKLFCLGSNVVTGPELISFREKLVTLAKVLIAIRRWYRLLDCRSCWFKAMLVCRKCERTKPWRVLICKCTSWRRGTVFTRHGHCCKCIR